MWGLRWLLVLMLLALLGCTSARARAEREFEQGRALLQERNREQASVHFEEAIRLDPTYAPSYNGRGNVLEGQGRLEEARQAYDRCLELDPTYWKAWMNRGSLLQEQGRMDDARRDLDRAVELAPQEGGPRAVRGFHLLQGVGRPDLALADLDAALDLAPDDLLVRFHRSQAWFVLGEHRAALRDLDVLVRAHPRDPIALTNRALALKGLGQYEEALRDLRTARQFAADAQQETMIRFNLVQSLVELGDLEGAADALQGLADAAPPGLREHAPEVQARLDLAAGRFAAALPPLEAAVRKDPGRASVRALLVRALAGAGRTREARQQGERALRDWPGTDLPLLDGLPPDVAQQVRRRVAALPEMKRQEEALRQALGTSR